jgi:hypothetical protein
VYTALHVNIPPEKATKLQKAMTKVKWVLIGMFAPELVVFVAWCQRQQALKLSKDLQPIFEEEVCRLHIMIFLTTKCNLNVV